MCVCVSLSVSLSDESVLRQRLQRFKVLYWLPYSFPEITGHILDEPDIPEQLLWVGAVGFLYVGNPLRVQNF